MTNIQLFTIGHSTHSLERFLELLQESKIEVLADIRRFPNSRNCPQFNQDDLSSVLQDQGIEYYWLEALGGRRPKVNHSTSVNSGLRNQSFRNYADYMLTDQFEAGMKSLSEIAQAKRTVIMCAENFFWRCHRRLVSDFVVANGGSVQHIFPAGDVKPHFLTEGAKPKDGKVTYPGQMTLFE